MDDVKVRNPIKTANLKVDEFYTLENIFAELDRLQDENDALKTEVSNLQDDIRDNYKRIATYEEIGMTEADFR